MQIIKYFGFGLLAFIVGLYAFSNILLPVFYSIPKFIKEKKKGNLNKKIPYLLLVWPVILWSSILIVGFIIAQTKIPDKITQVIIGLVISMFLIILKLLGKSKDVEADFNKAYRTYFN